MDSFKSWTKNEELKSWARDTIASIENCAERMKDKRLSDKDRDSFGVMLVQLSQAIKHDAEYSNNLAMRDMSNWLLDAFDALINDDVAAFEAKYEILRQLSFFGEVLISEEDRVSYVGREDGRTYIDFIPSSLTNEQSNQIVEHLQSIGAKFDPEVGQWYVEADWEMPELSQGEQEYKNEGQPERLNGEDMEYKYYYEDKLIKEVTNEEEKVVELDELLKLVDPTTQQFDWEKVKIERDGRIYSWKMNSIDFTKREANFSIIPEADSDGIVDVQVCDASLTDNNDRLQIESFTSGNHDFIVQVLSPAIENAINDRVAQLKERFSVLIQNRNEFEKGNPAGVFLSLPATKEELHEAMKALNITADNPHDFFLNGYSTDENRRIEIPFDWIRDGDLDKLNFLAARLGEMSPEQFEKLDAIMHSDLKPSSLDALINVTFNTDFFSYVPGILSYKELGNYLLNDSGKVQMPELWKTCIDKEDFATNVAINEDGMLTDYGYIAKSGTAWRVIFTGKEIPEQYRIMSYPESERTNQEQNMDENQTNVTTEAIERSMLEAVRNEAIGNQEMKMTKYKAIYYDGKDRKEIFADSKEYVLQAVQEAKPDRKETDRCYIQEREADSENYRNEGIYLIESGRDVTPVELKRPYISQETYSKIKQEFKEMGAKFDGNKKVFYAERSLGEEAIKQLQDFLDRHDEGIYLNLPKTKTQEEFKAQVEQLSKDGARYNPDKKAWYITEKTDRSKFADYLPAEKNSIHAKLEQNKKTAEQSEQGKDRSMEPKNKDNHERA